MDIQAIRTYENAHRYVVESVASGRSGAIFLEPERLPQAAAWMLAHGHYLEEVTAVEFEEGFQAQYRFCRFHEPGRVTFRILAEHEEPVLPTISAIYPGADWHERECMDFFPMRFSGHPNPAPLLLAETMADLHPLEKKDDHKKSFHHFMPEDSIVDCGPEYEDLGWSFQELEPLPRGPEYSRSGARPPLDSLEPGDFYTRRFQATDSKDRLILNMGPQHPSTHGVLRVLLELDGEYVVRAEPVLGYIHRMHEKIGESKSYSKFLPNTGRVDYLHALAWNHAYVLAVEKLLGLEVPERAELIRILTVELNRVTSHLLWWGAYLLDLGAFTPIMYGFEDRERIMDVLQRLTGSRLTYSCFRFGGVCADLPQGFAEQAQEVASKVRSRLPMFKALVTDNLILRKRVEEVGMIDESMCRRYGATGPVLRGAGVAYDVRRAEPYSLYQDFDFEIPAYTECDALARYLVRMDEMEQSLNIIDQTLERLVHAKGGHMVEKPPKPGFKPPVGEVYAAVEGARGKIGVYVLSDGSPVPYRLKLRSPSFSNLSLLDECSRDALLANVVAILGSLDLVIPEIDR